MVCVNYIKQYKPFSRGFVGSGSLAGFKMEETAAAFTVETERKTTNCVNGDIQSMTHLV